MNFPIPLYLNQKYVFDILAMIDNGFSHIQTLKTVESSAADASGKVSGQIGLSNVFALLGVKIDGEKVNSSKNSSQSELESQKIHTPNSLFAKVLQSLDEKELIKKSNIMSADTGEFILFKSTLRKNPVIDNLESYFALFRLFLGFSADVNHNKSQKNETNNNKKMLEQMEGLVKQMKEEGSLDIISDSVGIEKGRAVLTIDRDYLNDPSLSDIADGEFYVFGKLIRSIKDESDSINLLRKTSLSRIDDDMLASMFSGFENLSQHGMKNAVFMKEVKGPAIQVLPIAIFA
jgi:hypothetical protein